jgi:hypothetical protein
VRWHFVGGLQTNKARSVATYADVVHSVDRPELVTRLSAGRGARGPPARRAAPGQPGRRPGARGRCPPTSRRWPPRPRPRRAAAGRRDGGGPAGSRPGAAFAELAAVPARWSRAPDATAMSAGMSGDLEQAVRRGATHVRVGTALLGARALSAASLRTQSDRPTAFRTDDPREPAMSGTMRKLGLYLGLVEDDEEGLDARDRATATTPTTTRTREPVAATSRRWAPPTTWPDHGAAPGAGAVGSVRTRGSVALDTSLRAAPAPGARRGLPDHHAAPAHLQRGAARSASTSAAARR